MGKMEVWKVGKVMEGCRKTTWRVENGREQGVEGVGGSGM
jgi:hypothetical protein